MSPQRTLIIGGGGFLGAHLTERFRESQTAIRILDVATPQHWTVNPNVEYVQGDLRDSSVLSGALEGVDSVIHAAFASPHQPLEVIEAVNVEGTRNVCASAVAHGVQRLVLISSTIVLKPEKRHPIFNQSPLNRLDLYRTSRAQAEHIAADYGGKSLSVAIARPKTLVGPGRVSAFAILLERIRLGLNVPILGTGANRYQLVDIRDFAEGIRLLERSDASGVFFFGARVFATVAEDLGRLLEHAKTGARLQFIPPWAARAALKGIELANVFPLSEWHYATAYEEDSVVDISRAVTELGWQTERSNAQALQSAYDWYVESVARTGDAKTTHPVPLMHQVLKKLTSIFS